MKVWGLFQDNGEGEADSLISLYDSEIKANEALKTESVYGGYIEELEVE